MRLSFAMPALLAALVGSGCGPGLVRASHVQRMRGLPSGARAGFDPARFESVFAAAVELVRSRGHEIITCEAPFGLMTSAPIELDAGCGATTCLAREIARVKLGHRRARVTLTREVWDTTIRGWTRQEDAVVREELSRAERDLVERMVAADDDALRRAAEEDPCLGAHQRPGAIAATQPSF